MKQLVKLRMRFSRDGTSFLYMLDYKDETGKRRQPSLGHADKRKAESQRRQKEVELRMGIVGPRPMRLSEFRDDCLERTKGQVRSSSLREYRDAMDHFVQCAGNIDLGHVHFRHGERFIQWCMDRGNAPATVAKKVRHVKRLFQLAIDRGQLEEHPWRRLKTPRVPKKKVRVFSDKEVQRLLKAARDYDAEGSQPIGWELVLHLTLVTGMRWGELMNTTWRDIDFEDKTVDVSPKKDTENTWEWHIKDTHRRTLPLTDAVLDRLTAYQGEQPEGYPYVFLTPKRYDHIQAERRSGRWTVERGRRPSNNFHRSYRILLRRAGVDGSFHDLRRTALSGWLSNGLGEFDVMHLAGHSSFQTTHTFYLAVRRDLIDHARTVVEGIESQNLLHNCDAPPLSSDLEKSRPT